MRHKSLWDARQAVTSINLQIYFAVLVKFKIKFNTLLAIVIVLSQIIMSKFEDIYHFKSEFKRLFMSYRVNEENRQKKSGKKQCQKSKERQNRPRRKIPKLTLVKEQTHILTNKVVKL